MKQAQPYKETMPFESEFSHRFASWANNHRGWAKMKKYNKRLAKRKMKQQWKKEMEEDKRCD